MSVRLRLRRMGKTHRPFYRICAIERGRARDAKYIESIGYYDPFIEDDSEKFHLDKERAEYWLSVGATASDTVMNFLRKAEVAGLVPTKKTKSRPKRTLNAEKRAARDERLARKRKRKQKGLNKQPPPAPKEEVPEAEADEAPEVEEEVLETQNEAAESQAEEAPAEEAPAEEAPAEEAPAEEAPAEEAPAEEAPAEEASAEESEDSGE
ncbi:MAG: 30S ribosomal protein S16 [Planctomycetes bacterium]|nr:30S ribosomal protein S16 [Planctomycetota bacterium]